VDRPTGGGIGSIHRGVYMYTMSNSPLTDRQQAVLDYLAEHAALHGLPPTLAELARAFGIQVNAARKHLQALAARGLLERVPGKARGIRLPAPELLASTALPLVGRVAAGAPILSEGHIEARYAVDPALFRPRAHFLLRVEGDSMCEVGILDGDLIAVHRTPEARDGQIVVARLEGELTVKRLCRRDGRLRLLPENRDHAPIEVPADAADFAVEGLYVGCIRRA
jgi:repressor LexA